MLLSKSTFTVTPLCMSTFFTPIFSHTSLNILNILLIFLYLSSSFAMLLRTSVYVPLYCMFSSIGYAAIPQFHHSFFFPVLHSGHKIFFLSCSSTLLPIASFLPHSTHCTLVISLLFLILCFLAKVISYISYLSFKKKALPLIFIGLCLSTVISSTIHIGHYYLLCDSSFIKKKSVFWRHASLIIVLLHLFLYRMHWPLLHLLWSSHTGHLFFSLHLLLCYCYWTVPLEVSYLLIPKTLQLFLLLSLYFYFLPYTTPYYFTH